MAPDASQRVLSVAYYFPPAGGIASLRSARFAAGLSQFGWDATVLTRGHSLPPLGAPSAFGGRTIRTRSFELSQTGKSLLSPIASHASRSLRGSIFRATREFAHSWIYHPDPQIGWLPFALRAGRKALREGGFHAIFSSSVPITAHLIAGRLASEFRLPWVAEFRDPWTELIDPSTRRRAMDKAVRVEREIIQRASAIVTPSPSWGELFLSKGARRVSVITNGSQKASSTLVHGGPFVIAHIGSLYPEKQSLEVLWRALASPSVRQQIPDFRLRFVGGIPESVRREIRDSGMEGRLEVTGPVSHEEALRETSEASILIVAGPRDRRPVLRGMIPAKIFEYLSSNRPIIYVGALDSDAARILASHPGCFLADFGDESSARQAVIEASRTARVERTIDEFSEKVLSERLAMTLSEALNDPTSSR